MRDIVNSNWFSLNVLFLVLFSCIIFTIDTLPSLSPQIKYALFICEIGIVVLFTVEYGLRFFISEKWHGYVFSFYGIVDLLAILPFYLMLLFPEVIGGLIAARALRFIKAFSLFRNSKYEQSLRFFKDALTQTKEQIIVFFFFTLLILYFASVGIYYFESEAQPDAFSSIPQSFWWALATLTTVGYGDVYPITILGKVFTFFILMCGLGVVAAPAGIISSALARVISENNKDKEKAKGYSSRIITD